EQTARASAESSRRAAELQVRVSGLLAASLDYQAALTGIGDLVVPAAADVFLVDLLVDGRLEPSVSACSDALGAERLRTRRAPELAGDHPIARVTRTGEAMLVSQVTPDWQEHWAGALECGDLWERIGLASVVIVPIRSHRRTHGALTFGVGPSRDRFAGEDLRTFSDIGLRTALALDTGQLFRALEAEQRRREEFLAMLAHELRNPLGAVTNGIEALERASPSDRSRLLQILTRQSRHLARMLNDLLDVSGVRFGRLVLQQRSLDLRDLARDALEALRAAGKTKRPKITLRNSHQPVCVLGDPDRLMQLIANLLANAIKYTPGDGWVELGVETDGADALVRVRDSGMGIAPEFLPRIFEVFSRGQGMPEQSRPGLGLGLSVVRELIVKHSGSVSASSAGIGKGSEFVIRLPREPGQEPAPVASGTTSVSERSILIVEDNADAAEVLRLALELSGHRVRTASTGRQAIEQTLAKPPDV